MRPALAIVLFASVLLAAGDARAHPLGFAVISVRVVDVHDAEVVVRISGTESAPGRIELTWQGGCTESVERDTMHDEVRERRSHLRCDEAIVRTRMHVEGPDRGLEILVLTTHGGVTSRVSLRSLPADVALGAAEDTRALVVDRARLGAEHFARGIDHVLFVLGAFLLARRRGARAVAVAVTAFTLGHALTLTLAAFVAATLATRPVEACIALSLVHVARELRVEADTVTRRTPAIACGLFGLVHGAGLASASSSAGLAGADLAMSVASFNVGLELAELALVVALFAIVRGRITPIAERLLPLAIGGVGVWLLLARLGQ